MREYSEHQINFYLPTTYKKFIDQLRMEYPNVKLNYSDNDDAIKLQFKNFIARQVIFTISAKGEGIRVEGLYGGYDSGKWLQVFERRFKKHFGQAGQAEKGKETQTAQSLLTFDELVALEKAAFAGDKIAIEKFDRMLKEQGDEEGWEGWCKTSLEHSAQIEKWWAEWEEHKKKRDAIPYVKPIVDLATSMAESENPLYRAMVSDMPYHSIYTKAKALEKETLKSASTLPALPSTPTADQPGQAEKPKNKIEKERILPATLTERHKKLNNLAIIWAELNLTGKEKSYNLTKFIQEHVDYNDRFGLGSVGESEFTKHLVKAYKWGVIDKDSETGRYIPKTGN